MPQFELAEEPKAQVLIPVQAPKPTVPKTEPKPALPKLQTKPQAERQSKPAVRQENGQGRQANAGRAKQRAADAGGGAPAGAEGVSQASTGNAKQQKRLKSVWGSRIRARIARSKRYRSGQTGSACVVVSLTVVRDGRLPGARIVKSLGIAAFDKAALAAVKREGRFPKAPKKPQINQISFNQPISFDR